MGATVSLGDSGQFVTTDAKGRYRFHVQAAAQEASVSQVRCEGDLSKQNGDGVRLSQATSTEVITFSKTDMALFRERLRRLTVLKMSCLTSCETMVNASNGRLDAGRSM